MNNKIPLGPDEIQVLAYRGFLQQHGRMPTSEEGIKINRQCSSGAEKFNHLLTESGLMPLILVLAIMVALLLGGI